MIKFIWLSNRIGFAINIFGFKIPFIFGWKEYYLDTDKIYKTRNHWFARVPQGNCRLSTPCEAIWWYKTWRKYGYGFFDSLCSALRHR